MNSNYTAIFGLAIIVVVSFLYILSYFFLYDSKFGIFKFYYNAYGMRCEQCGSAMRFESGIWTCEICQLEYDQEGKSHAIENVATPCDINDCIDPLRKFAICTIVIYGILFIAEYANATLYIVWPLRVITFILAMFSILFITLLILILIAGLKKHKTIQ